MARRVDDGYAIDIGDTRVVWNGMS